MSLTFITIIWIKLVNLKLKIIFLRETNPYSLSFSYLEHFIIIIILVDRAAKCDEPGPAKWLRRCYNRFSILRFHQKYLYCGIPYSSNDGFQFVHIWWSIEKYTKKPKIEHQRPTAS